MNPNDIQAIERGCRDCRPNYVHGATSKLAANANKIKAIIPANIGCMHVFVFVLFVVEEKLWEIQLGQFSDN